MRKILIASALMCFLASCSTKTDPLELQTNRSIYANVKDIARPSTKGGDVAESFVLGTIGEDSLWVELSVSPNDMLPFEAVSATKGSVTTVDTLKKNSFTMDAWLGSENRYPNDINNGRTYAEGGSTGRVNDPNDANDFHFIKDAPVSYDADKADWYLGEINDKNPYIWRNAVPTTFWCHYPNDLTGITFPGDKSSDDEQGSLTFTYSPGKTAQSTVDAIFAYNKQSADFDNGGHLINDTKTTVDIKFHHALAGIRFDVSGMLDLGIQITSILLNGIAKIGTCQIKGLGSDDADFTWTVNNYTGSALQTFSSDDFTMPGLDAPHTEDALQDLTNDKIFFVVPQSVKDHNVTLIMTYTLTNGVQEFAMFTLNHDTAWEDGYIYTYKLSPNEWRYVFNVVGSSYEFNNTKLPSEVQECKVQSYKYSLKDPDTIIPIPFTAEYQNGSSWSTYDSDKTRVDGINAATTINDFDSEGNVVFELQARSRKHITDDGYRWRGKDETMRGSAAAPVDLSRMPVGGDGDGTSVMNTANSYIVKHPGYYKFPVVYGNSIQNGSATTSGYISSASGPTVLDHFVNAKGEDISSAYILSDIEAANPKVALLWSDAQENGELLIQDVQLVGSGDNAYITFKTASGANLVQGNAAIVLYDGASYQEGNALWQWLIWITDADVSASNVGVVDSDISFMSAELGRRDSRQLSAKVDEQFEEFKVRFKQVYTAEDKATSGFTDLGAREITIKQPPIEKVFRYTPPYFIHGRVTSFPGGVIEDNTLYHNPVYGAVSKFVYLPDGSYSESLQLEREARLGYWISRPYTFTEAGGYNHRTTNLLSRDLTGIVRDQTPAQKLQNEIGDVPVIKTIYDPSPYGYKVPNIKAYRELFKKPYADIDYSTVYSNHEYICYIRTFNSDPNLIFSNTGCFTRSSGEIRTFNSRDASYLVSNVGDSSTYEFLYDTNRQLFAFWNSSNLNTISDEYNKPVSLRPVLENVATVNPPLGSWTDEDRGNLILF